MTDPTAKILTLKITLCDYEPAIWRRFQIAGDMTLGDLHNAIQIVMGWENHHLHDFEQGKKRYSRPDPEDFAYDPPPIDEDEVTIGQVLKRRKQVLTYIYDMGDSWRHRVQVEDIAGPNPNQHYPNCLDGAYACPPEDCGGPWGYQSMLEALADPAHEEHETFVEWIGSDFDTEAFDLDEINKVLKDFKKYVSDWDRDDDES